MEGTVQQWYCALQGLCAPQSLARVARADLVVRSLPQTFLVPRSSLEESALRSPPGQYSPTAHGVQALVVVPVMCVPGGQTARSISTHRLV